MTDAVKNVFEIRFGVYCTEAQARDLSERFQLLLCPEPMHEGPCAIPWSSAHWALAAEEARGQYPALVEQVHHEQGESI